MAKCQGCNRILYFSPKRNVWGNYTLIRTFAAEAERFKYVDEEDVFGEEDGK